MGRPRKVVPELLVSDLLTIESLARHGMPVSMIATALGMSWQDFQAAMLTDPRLVESIEYGRMDGARRVSKSLFGAAESGTDTAASRFYLERIVGDRWAPPRAAGPQVTVVHAPLAPIDVDAMTRRFERQSRLLDGVTAEDLDAAPAAAETPDSKTKE